MMLRLTALSLKLYLQTACKVYIVYTIQKYTYSHERQITETRYSLVIKYSNRRVLDLLCEVEFG